MHHRHLVAEARHTIHREITENQLLLDQNLASLQADTTRMQSNIVVIRQLRDHPRSPHGKLSFDLAWSSFSASAWGTARDTGALAYMPYDELQGLSQTYGQQGYINGLGVALFNDQNRAPGILASETNVEDLQLDQLAQLMTRTTDILAQLASLEQRLTGLRHDFQNAAKLEDH